ncbi:MAG: peptidoglycan editing factor PgeF [Alphaproteobacteria bacterium]
MLPHVTGSLLSAAPGVRHAFFTRRGGASEGIFSSLNCGLGSGDSRAAVIENRARAASHLGLAPWSLLTVYQCHSPTCVTVDGPWPDGQAPEADAMVTRTADLALGILAADCAPVLLADAQAKVIGAAHAGWKGAFSGVIEATVGAMEELGASRARIVAAIGPCIAQASYEVGAEFETRFRERDPALSRFFVPGRREGHRQFDLAGFVASRLADSGIKQVDLAPADTYSNADDYFSFRRATHRGEADYGRNLSAIMLT